MPTDVHLTSDLAYFRWHGRGKRIWFDYNYGREELDSWVPKIQEASATTKKIFGYFNNHFYGYAPENCLYMLERLGLKSGVQNQVKKAADKQSRLGNFF